MIFRKPKDEEMVLLTEEKFFEDMNQLIDSQRLKNEKWIPFTKSEKELFAELKENGIEVRLLYQDDKKMVFRYGDVLKTRYSDGGHVTSFMPRKYSDQRIADMMGFELRKQCVM